PAPPRRPGTRRRRRRPGHAARSPTDRPGRAPPGLSAGRASRSIPPASPRSYYRAVTRDRPVRTIRGAAAWLDRVGLAALFPVSDLVLPSLWQAVSGRLELDWAVRGEDGSFVSFTPEMAKVWRWKDELPEGSLACGGK